MMKFTTVFCIAIALVAVSAAQLPTACTGRFKSDNFGVACNSDAASEIFSRPQVPWGRPAPMCTLRQPFYNSPALGWIKMTYSAYNLDFGLKVGGTVAAFPGGGCNADYSGLSAGGTGSITSTETSSSGNLRVDRTWTLASSASRVLTLNVVVTNIGATVLNDVAAYWGTRDDWVGNTDGPEKVIATVVSGQDAEMCPSGQSCGGNAMVVKSGAEACILYSPDPSARAIRARCCSFTNIYDITNPATFTATNHANDGSYAVYVNAGDIAPGASKTYGFIYGVGDPAALNELAREAGEQGDALTSNAQAPTTSEPTPMPTTAPTTSEPTPMPTLMPTTSNKGKGAKGMGSGNKGMGMGSGKKGMGSSKEGMGKGGNYGGRAASVSAAGTPASAQGIGAMVGLVALVAGTALVAVRRARHTVLDNQEAAETTALIEDAKTSTALIV